MSRRVNISLNARLHAMQQRKLLPANFEERTDRYVKRLGAHVPAPLNIAISRRENGGIPLDELFEYVALWYIPFNCNTDILGAVYKREKRIETSFRWRHYGSPLLVDPTGEDSWYSGTLQSENDIETFRRFWVKVPEVHLHLKNDKPNLDECPACRDTRTEWHWIKGNVYTLHATLESNGWGHLL